MKKTIIKKTCAVCGKEYYGGRSSMFCSPQCYNIARRERRSNNRQLRAIDNSKKYADLIRYVEENNLREILKKYLPGKAA